jgi:hypothetical protein
MNRSPYPPRDPGIASGTDTPLRPGRDLKAVVRMVAKWWLVVGLVAAVAVVIVLVLVYGGSGGSGGGGGY